MERIDPLPETDITFINVDDLLAKINEADGSNCEDSSGQPLLTLLDFRAPFQQASRRGSDKYRIKTNCRTITALLDEFIDNKTLIDSIPDTGQVVAICETGNRDRFLIRYLSKFGKKNIVALKYGIRGWIKANYPVEKITH